MRCRSKPRSVPLLTHMSWAPLAGRKVAFLSRHGRGHRLMPTELNFRANIHGFKQLGVERIISLSAVGSLKEEHRPLDFVVPKQFVDRTRHRVDTFFGEGLVAHIGFGRPICEETAEFVEQACRRAGVNVKLAVPTSAWRDRSFPRRPSPTCIAVGAWMSSG